MKRNRRLRPKRTGHLVRERILRAMRPIVVAGAVGGLMFGLNLGLRIEHIRVHAADASLAEAVKQHITRMQPLDFWHSRPTRIREELLRSIPDLREVHVLRTLPNTLDVRAVPRQPVALWLGRDEQVWLVDAKGKAYRPIRASEVADLPLLRCSRERLREAVAIITVLQKIDPKRANTLSECIALAEGWQLNFDRRQRWLLPAHAAERLKRVVALLKENRWRSGLWRVDARLPSRWFIRHAIQGGVI